MKKIYVNAIIEKDGLIQGLSVHNITVAENLTAMFDRSQLTQLISSLKDNPTGEGYTFFRFCQYVILFENRKNVGLKMEVLDFKNANAVFDYYMDLTDHDWREEDKQNIISIYNDIDDNKGETAEMILKDEVRVPE